MAFKSWNCNTWELNGGLLCYLTCPSEKIMFIHSYSESWFNSSLLHLLNLTVQRKQTSDLINRTYASRKFPNSDMPYTLGLRTFSVTICPQFYLVYVYEWVAEQNLTILFLFRHELHVQMHIQSKHNLKFYVALGT